MYRMRIWMLTASFIALLALSSSGSLVHGQRSMTSYFPLIEKSRGPANIVADLTPGAQGSTFYQQSVAVRGDTLFFVPNCNELWKSDGSSAGTTRLKSFSENAPSFCPYARNLTLLGNTVFFTVHNTFGASLWRSDGSVAGTTEVLPIPLSGSGTTHIYIYGLTALNESLYFSVIGSTANETINTAELWRSDGSAAGTARIRSLPAANVGQPVVLNGKLFFNVYTQSTDALWVSDGSAVGTHQIATTSGIYSLTPSANALWFTSNGPQGYELWTSNGTSAGTHSVKPFSYNLGPNQFTELNGRTYFSLYFPLLPSYSELWSTNGTASGTTQIIGGEVDNLTVHAGRLFFVNSQHLYRSDGTSVGTTQVSPTAIVSGPLFSVDQQLYFEGYSTAAGSEPWISDGTAAGTFQVQDINPGVGSSHFQWLGRTTNTFFFAADDGEHGLELWSLPLSR